jgi:hypothetical protein
MPLPQIEGRIDHLTVDLHSQRLFVAALGNNTVEVLNLKAGAYLHTITGLHKPQGVLFLPDFKRLGITNGTGDTNKLLIVFDTASGKPVARLESAGDADDVFYDAARLRIYASSGAGVLSVFAQHDTDHYTLMTRLPTADGARTSLLVPEFHRLYLAVPHRGTQSAEIRVYDVQP